MSGFEYLPLLGRTAHLVVTKYCNHSCDTGEVLNACAFSLIVASGRSTFAFSLYLGQLDTTSIQLVMLFDSMSGFALPRPHKSRRQSVSFGWSNEVGGRWRTLSKTEGLKVHDGLLVRFETPLRSAAWTPKFHFAQSTSKWFRFHFPCKCKLRLRFSSTKVSISHVFLEYIVIRCTL